MSNLKILIKYNFLKLLGGMQGKKQRKSTSTAIGLLILGMAGIFALYTLQAQSMFLGLAPLGLSNICLFHCFLTALSVIVIIGIMRMTGNQKSDDLNLLLSMPLTKAEIIISKTLNKYVFDLFFSFVLIIPFIIMYFIYNAFSLQILLFSLLVMFLLPLLSVGLSYIFDFVITRLFNRSKFSGIFKSMFSVLIFIVIMALMMIKTFGYGTVNPASINEYMSDRPVTYLFIKFILNSDLISLLYILLLTIVPFITGILLYSINLGKNFLGYSSKENALKFKTSKNLFSSLLKKEANAYAITPAYVTNTIIGPILILALGILVSVVGAEKISQSFGIALEQNIFMGFSFLAICMGCSLTLISCCSISLEGKNFWILKSSPINLNTLFLSKIMFHILMVEPAIIVCSVMLLFALKLTIINFLLLLFISTLVCVCMAVSGVFINLLFPKMEWEEETQVVKQGLATLLEMLVGFILTAIPIVLYLLIPALSIPIIGLIIFAIYIVLVVVFTVLLFTVGKKLFYKI